MKRNQCKSLLEMKQNTEQLRFPEALIAHSEMMQTAKQQRILMGRQVAIAMRKVSLHQFRELHQGVVQPSQMFAKSLLPRLGRYLFMYIFTHIVSRGFHVTQCYFQGVDYLDSTHLLMYAKVRMLGNIHYSFGL